MPPETTVRRFRISAIWPSWTAAVLERAPSTATYEKRNPLWGPTAYAGLVRALVREEGGLPPAWQLVGLPWDDAADATFWREYSTERPTLVADTLVPRNAAYRNVPLHVPGKAPHRPPWKLGLHHFVYPFGVATLLHAEYPHPDASKRGGRDAPPLSLEGVVEACYDLRGDRDSQSSWDEWVAGSIDPVTNLLGGPELEQETALTVVTFIEVDDVLDLDEARRDRVLSALTGWPERPTWPKAEVDRLDVRLTGDAVEGRVVHAASRGRTIWFPDGFAGGTTLSAGHRRLCFTTMQTEMITRFMLETAPRLPSLPPAWDDWAKKAARTIGLLYGDRLAASDSDSPRVQIESSGGVDRINRVLAHFEREPLH